MQTTRLPHSPDLPSPEPLQSSPQNVQPPISPEMNLLIDCARTQIADPMAQHIRTLCGSALDWAVLLQLAHQHRLLPLLYINLNTICPELVPAPILQELQRLYRQNGLHNLRFTGELIQLLKTLKAQGFEAVPFKGPVLAIAAYGNLNLRMFGDLDILVQAKDYLPVRNFLISQGYTAGESWHFSTVEEEAHITWFGECTLIHPERRVSIDLHQRLVAGYLFRLSRNFDAIWTRLKPISILDKTVESLKPEDLLLYLCIHGTKDFWQRLSGICDIAEFIERHPTLQWDEVFEQAKEHRAERMLRLGLLLAQQILGTTLPPEIQTRLKPDALLEKRVRSIRQKIYENTIMPPGGATLNELSSHIQVMDDWSERLHLSYLYLWHWTFFSVRKWIRPTANDRLFCQLPDAWYGLYYLIRPFRLTIKGLTHK
jgi:hypothetical protein